MLGTDLFVRTSRQVELTAAGRALLEEAPVALAALERAAKRAQLTGAGIAGEIRLCYTPMANFEILRVILTAIETRSRTLWVPNIPSARMGAGAAGVWRVGGFRLSRGWFFPQVMRSAAR
jgi:hypothetical protein